jgi:hypothetical protein
MTRTELILQILKVVVGLAFGAYFVWWSLEVLDRLTPEDETPTAMVGAHHEGHHRRTGYPPWLCTLAFEHHEKRTPTQFAKSWRREHFRF